MPDIVTNVLYQDIDRLQEKVKELEAENKRLVALNDTFPPEIARLEDRVSEEYEAERADDRVRIRELEDERDADRRREDLRRILRVEKNRRENHVYDRTTGDY